MFSGHIKGTIAKVVIIVLCVLGGLQLQGLCLSFLSLLVSAESYSLLAVLNFAVASVLVVTTWYFAKLRSRPHYYLNVLLLTWLSFAIVTSAILFTLQPLDGTVIPNQPEVSEDGWLFF